MLGSKIGGPVLNALRLARGNMQAVYLAAGKRLVAVMFGDPITGTIITLKPVLPAARYVLHDSINKSKK